MPETLDLRALALTVIVGGVLMLAAYAAVWAGVRWWGRMAALAERRGEEPERTSAAGKSDVWGHHENGLTP